MGIDYTGKTHTHGTSMGNSTTKVNQFEIFMDEPEIFGGKDSAPGPLDFLLAAHGGCLSFMTFFIAKEMGLDIESADISIRADLDCGKFTGKAMDVRAGYQVIDVDIQLKTNAPADQVEKLRQAVEERCPVSNNIAQSTPVSVAMTAS